MGAIGSLQRRLAATAARIAESQSAFPLFVKRLAAFGQAVPEPLRAPDTAGPRLTIAPFNYSGQARQWARTATDPATGTAAVNLGVLTPNGYGFPADATVPVRVFLGSRVWQRAQRAEFERCSHLLVESFTSPLGSGRGAAFRAEIAGLQAAGVRVGLIAHGSDIRSAGAFRFSPFDPADPATAAAERRSREAKRLIADTGLPVFVSTPDLLHDVPDATWLPLVVDDEPWRVAGEARPLLAEARPVVMHAPTAPQLKGSSHVDAAMRSIGGRAEYRRLLGIPASEMPGTVASADIVVDQLLLGSYGVAACEALASGRVVVGNVDAGIRDRVSAIAGIELPIVQADPETIEDVLAGLLERPEEIRRLGALGPGFVSAVHTGARTRAALADFLGA